MSDDVFPTFPGREWPIGRVLEVSMQRQRAASGKSRRAAFARYPLQRFELSYSVLRDELALEELQTMVGFHGKHLGSGRSFLHLDASDFEVVDQSLGLGDGVRAAFQLKRSYGAGGFTSDDIVQNVQSIVEVADNGTPITQGADPDEYQVSSTGLITLNTPLNEGHTLTWSGSYYHRCRFLSDELDFRNFMVGLWDLRQLDFVGSTQNKVGI